jgi:acyl transferase domain-containing protein
MDPQQRLLLTYSWKAIEDAGYSPRSLSGTKTGVFIGIMNSGYDELASRAGLAIEGYSATSTVPSVGPNRISYFLNLHGPSEAVETACSSSLVAVDHAITSILDGTCDMALAGGVNVILTPNYHISFNKAGMLSQDGRCKTFSDKADGYVRSEGIGIVFLKKLSDAERCGDHIYGIIKSSAVNHGGKANSLTSPNPNAQAEVLITAYRKANVDPRTVGYIETHGTGTALGDPVENNGLKAAFKELYRGIGESETIKAHCGLGSVKTNMVHLEVAAGVAGLMKAILQLKYKTLVKNLHCDNINPYILLDGSPFYIVRENQEWKAMSDSQGRTLPRIAGVSSFGFGGTNAHVVLEEYIPVQSSERIDGFDTAAIILSGKTDERLKEQAEQLLYAVNEGRFSKDKLFDIAYTLQLGREAMEERLAFTAGSIEELKQKLLAFIEGRSETNDIYRGQARRNKMQ